MSELPRGRVLGADAVELLFEILEGPRAELSAAAAKLTAGGEQLLASDLLARIGDETVAASDDDHSDALVSLFPTGEEGPQAYFSASAGIFQVAPEALSIFRADVPAVLGCMTRGLGLPRSSQPAVLIDKLVWEVGAVRLPKQRRRPTVWFARRLWDRRGREAIEEAMRRRPTSETRVILTSTAADRIGGLDLPGAVVVPILDALVARDQLAISPEMLATRLGAPAGLAAAARISPGRYVLTADRRQLIIDGSAKISFRPGAAQDAIVTLHAAHVRGERLPIGELTDLGSMRRLFGAQWPRLKPYITVIDRLWGFAE